jgi:hypothetical protein
MTPPLPDKNPVGMSIEELMMCSMPPLHDNPDVDYAAADDKTRDWLYNGTMPQSADEVKAIAVFCVKQNLPDALSWLVMRGKLDHLDMAQAILSDQGAQMIASWLERCPRRITLDLSWNDIREKGAIALANALKKNSTLTSLNLADNKIRDIGATALADALKSNSTLTSLDVEYNDIRAPAAQEFAEALKTNSTLASLNVEGNPIGYNGAIALAEVLKTNSTLTWLNVSYNGIGDDGATALAHALKTNSTMTGLDVGGNEISDIGIVAFADTLGTNSTLTELWAANNVLGEIGESALADIQRRLDVNKRAKPLAAPAAEALTTLASSRGSGFPLEVGALIVQNMITLGPDQGDSVQGLESLVIGSSIMQKRELATEALQSLPTFSESELPPEVCAMVVDNMTTLGHNGVQGLESLVIANDIVNQRKHDEKG